MPQELNKKPSIKDPQAVAPTFLSPLILEQIFNFIYPIGSYYFNKSDPRSPTEIFGIGCGTWVAETGYFPVGKAASGTFSTLGATGGAETVTLTTTQIPSHTHDVWSMPVVGWVTSGDRFNMNISGQGGWSVGTVSTRPTGGGGSHPNLPPYRVVSMWVRTA